MTTPGFRFDLFNPSFHSILSNCKYINLPFSIHDISQEVNYLLTKCGEFFFQDTTGPDYKEKLEECAENAKVILDISWEKINTGHWKDVNPHWRYAFSFASLFKALCLLLNENANKFDIIKACDMGLLMGFPLMQNILSKIAFEVSKMLAEEKGPKWIACDIEREIKKVKTGDNFDLEFPLITGILDSITFQQYVNGFKPVRLADGVSDWPAFILWNVDYILKMARFRTVPIEIGSKYTDDNWTQKLMTIEEFVDKFIAVKPREIGYLAQHNIFDQIPELREDIRIPDFIVDNYGNLDCDISIYFGPQGTVSPLHYDPKHNFLAQVIGKKYLRLYSYEATKCLYPRLETLMSNTSQVDVDNPDHENFPWFQRVPYQECILTPGDLLYIPPGWWHYARSLTVSVSISFWCDIPGH